MTAKQFQEVFAMAKYHDYDTNECFCNEAFTALQGIALDKKRRIATKKHCAYILNWQALYFNGEYDIEEVATMKEYYKRVDLLD